MIVCAEPVTGSSSMPAPGAKNRETKSVSSPGAVAMMYGISSRLIAAKSGFSDATWLWWSNTAMIVCVACSALGVLPRALPTAASNSGSVTSGASCAGKSISSRSPSRSTVSRPLRVWNATDSSSGVSLVNTTCPDASVAWPHRSTSILGVNHRRSYSPSGR